MKIPVFLAVQADDNLLKSALSARFGRDARLALREKLQRRFNNFSLDAGFEVIPAGRAMARRIGIPELNLDGGPLHDLALRGTIEVDTMDDVPDSIDGSPVLADPIVGTYLTCLGDNPIGSASDVATKLNLAALHASGLDGDGVAIAIVDGGINIAFLEQKLGFRPKLDTAYSWRPPGLNVEPGGYPPGHGTMCAYAALLAAPKATLIDVPAFVGTPIGGSVMGQRLGIAYQGIAQLSAFWSIAFTPSGAPKYKALVISNSWGMYHPSHDFPAAHRGRYSDNPLHVFTRSISAMSQIDKVDIVFAAGNCGGECPDEQCRNVTSATITGANACLDVLTVAGCNLSDERVGYSSQGPGIAGMAPNKPDLTAYTHFKGSEALGTGKPDKGTSAAGPLVAGCIAAIRTKLDPVAGPPTMLNDHLRQSARRPQGADWNKDVGHGIVDPVATAVALGLLPTG
jgi:Subtilase family